VLAILHEKTAVTSGREKTLKTLNEAKSRHIMDTDLGEKGCRRKWHTNRKKLARKGAAHRAKGQRKPERRVLIQNKQEMIEQSGASIERRRDSDKGSARAFREVAGRRKGRHQVGSPGKPSNLSVAKYHATRTKI